MSIPRGVLPDSVRPRRPTLPRQSPESSYIPPSPGLPLISTSYIPSPPTDLLKIPPTSGSSMLPLVTTASGLTSQVAPTTIPFVDSISNHVTNADTIGLQISHFVTASSFQTSTDQSIANLRAVCIGNGLDSSSVGILSSLIIPTAVGLVIWVRGIGFVAFRRLMILLMLFQLFFGIVRPRFRQVYGLREWFVQPE